MAIQIMILNEVAIKYEDESTKIIIIYVVFTTKMTIIIIKIINKCINLDS